MKKVRANLVLVLLLVCTEVEWGKGLLKTAQRQWLNAFIIISIHNNQYLIILICILIKNSFPSNFKLSITISFILRPFLNQGKLNFILI